MRKIVFTGPESSGKSSLARLVALYYGCPLVPEIARSYLSILDTNYQVANVIEIARYQCQLEESLYPLIDNFLVCDTSILVPKMWLSYRFTQKVEWIDEKFELEYNRFFFLCAPDLPWQEDSLRENPRDRWSLFYLYLKELIASGHPYRVLHGSIERRMADVKQALMYLS